MADGLVIKHPQTGAVIFNMETVTSHSRATFNTNGAAGNVSVADLLRGEPYIIQALPTDPGQEYGITDFTISGSTISWENAARPMRVMAGSYASGGPAGSKTFDGFMVRRPGGALQISTADFALQLASYGSLILTDDGGTHPQPMVTGSVTVSGNSPVMAFRGEDGAEISLRSVSRSGSQFTFHFACRASSPVGLIHWIFDTTQQGLALNTDAALVLKDNTGVKTFDSRVYAMNVLTTREASTEGSASTVSPSGGQSLAVIQSTSGWRQTMYDLGGYNSSVSEPSGAVIGDVQVPRPAGTRWVYMKLESYHATTTFSGGSATVGMQRFEDFEDWYPVDQQPHDSRWGKARHTIINVAGLPAAAMPNPSEIAVSVSAVVREVSTQSAGSANTISPASVANGSGGTAPYSYLWQYVSGSTLIAAYDVTSSASFRTQSLNQPAGETRETVWRCRVTDAAGRVGYSQPVTFRHAVERVDYIPDPINFQNASVSVPGEVAAVISNYQALDGITHPITLRFKFTYSGNLSAGGFYIHSATRNGFIAAGVLGSGQLDVSVNPGEQICIYCDGSTTSGRRSGQWSVNVTNLSSAGAAIDTVTLNITVDSDNNYNVADYTLDPGAISFYNNTKHSTKDDDNLAFGGGYATGINQNITLTAVVSPVFRGGSVPSHFQVFVGTGVAVFGAGDTSDKSFSFSVSPDQYVGASASLAMFPGSGDAWAYWHVDVFNSSTGEFVSGFDGGLTTVR